MGGQLRSVPTSPTSSPAGRLWLASRQLAKLRAHESHLYTLLFHLGLPLVFLRLLWRAWRAPAYSRRIGERFAFGLPRLRPGGIWVHAVSVGEASPRRRWSAS